MIIYKYEIEVVNKWFKLELPKNAKPLSFQNQITHFAEGEIGKLMLWVSHDEREWEYEEKGFIALGTGFKMGMDKAEYLGTAQENGFVWHLFWRP